MAKRGTKFPSKIPSTKPIKKSSNFQRLGLITSFMIVAFIVIVIIPSLFKTNQDVFHYPDYHSKSSGQWFIWNQLPNIEGMTGDEIIEAFKDKPTTVTCRNGKKVHWTGVFIPEDENGLRYGQGAFSFVAKDLTWQAYQKEDNLYGEYIRSLGKEQVETFDALDIYFRVKLSMPAAQKARIAAVESPIGLAGVLCYMMENNLAMNLAGFVDADASLLADGLSKLYIYQDAANWNLMMNEPDFMNNDAPRWDGNFLPPCEYIYFTQRLSGYNFVSGDISRFTACVNV